MIVYLTYNDAPSGIYSSQVIDVIKFLRQELKADVRLLALISLRNYRSNRRKIKAQLPDAMVRPMFPGVHRWLMNVFLLRISFALMKPEKVIGRSVLATQLAMRCGADTVIYDGRGAISAEWKEYQVVGEGNLLHEIEALEKQCVLQTRFRISISNELVKWWEKQFSYAMSQHAVIPCTLHSEFENAYLSATHISSARKLLGLETDDLVFVYSGSLAGWQSFSLLYDYMRPVLKRSSKNKILFLCPPDTQIRKLEAEFPQQIVCRSVEPAEVPLLLQAADYGLLIREQSITNQVASPVKFAEYLASGLKVIISENLGDYSDFVKKQACGHLAGEMAELKKLSFEEKQSIRDTALKFFSKRNYSEQYRTVLTS